MESSKLGRRRRLRAPERRVLILEAALATFAERGYEAAAMEEIATAAGVSKAVVYDHVRSKRELYTVLLNEICEDLVEVLEAALTAEEPAGEARVRIATEAFFGYVEQHPQASRLLVLELQGANVSAVGRDLEERLTENLRTQLEGGGLLADHPQRDRQLEIFAELLKHSVQGLASWWFLHPELPRRDLVERTVAFLWPAIRRATSV